MKPQDPTQHDDNQGEGDRRSARDYNEQLREFMDHGKVAPAAQEAKAYVERSPDDAARAEREARRGPAAAHGSRVTGLVEELAGKARTYAERARPIVARAIGKLRARYGQK
jgi:hypothetical protein